MSDAKMKVGSKEHYDLLAQFEKNFKNMRTDREKDKTLWRVGQVYESGETNVLYKAYILGYSLGKTSDTAADLKNAQLEAVEICEQMVYDLKGYTGFVYAQELREGFNSIKEKLK